MRARFALLAVAGLVVLGLAALPAAATPTPQRATIRLGPPGKAAGQWPFLMAMARGTFNQMNLDIDFAITRTEPLAMQYLVSNSIDMTILSPGAVYATVEAGGNVTVIGGIQNKMT